MRPILDGGPAPAGTVTWSMDADPVLVPLEPDDGPNEVLDRDVWTSTDGKRRIRDGNRWLLSGPHVIGWRYERMPDLVVPGSSDFDVSAELSDDWVNRYRRTLQSLWDMRMELADIWHRQGGDYQVVKPRPIKGGVTFLGDQPENPLLGDRWIQGTDRDGPALVWALVGDSEQWVEQEARPA